MLLTSKGTMRLNCWSWVVWLWGIYANCVNVIRNDRNEAYHYRCVPPDQRPWTVTQGHQSGVTQQTHRLEGLVGLAATGLACLVGMPGKGQMPLGGDIHRYALSVQRHF